MRPPIPPYSEDYDLPDLKNWGKVKKGMTEKQVTGLLGAPNRKVGPENGIYEPNHHHPWYYGYTSQQSKLFLHDLDLVVHFEMGKVSYVSDWFGGVPLSKDGLPTVPKLLKPKDGVTFEHFPRTIDLRWFAASGEYPMRYEVDVNTLYPSGEWSRETQWKTSHPFYNHVHGGANKGRWRIRSVNRLGTSEWSDYRHFNFTR